MLATVSTYPLQALSILRWKCSVCGETGHGFPEKEQAVWWIACECGHVFPTPNRITWN